ncbi:MAG: multidrug efflux MFS transporter [Lactobacillus sp.]|nr:multidrug efflux MFS transporter [Lactobacillus sp.]
MATEAKQPASWRKTFITLWIGCFMTGLNFSMTMPFMALYIETLYPYGKFELNLYSGLAFAVTYLAQAIVSPLWGSLADQKGRKLMCLRASGVMTFTIFAVGLVHHAWTIVLLRFIQGAFSGYINNAVAFIAGETPHERSGSVMANMMTANVTGNLLGPLVGGLLAGFAGYRVTFFVCGAMMGIVFLLTLFNTKEHFTPIPAKKMKPMKEIFRQLENKNLIFTMFVTTLFVQSALMSIAPIVSLLVKSLMHGAGNVSLASGIVAAMPGFGTLLVASRLGVKMDSVGPLKILTLGLVAATLVFIPMYFVSSPWTLGFWRFLLGIANAALLPAVQTVLTISVPREAFGRIFSYNQSFQAAGSMIGSMMGAFISGIFDYQAVFVVTAMLMFINLILILKMRRATAA